MGNNCIDYSNWHNLNLQNLAKAADKDETKGLNGIEIFNFAQRAVQNGVESRTVSEILGLELSSTPTNTPANSRENRDPLFQEAVNYYNDSMDYEQRYNVTNKTNTNLEERLFNMEKSIDQAFIDCAAYQDIVIIPGRYYRFYPYVNDRLLNFDINEIRNLTSKDMNALHELKNQIEYIIEEANGETTHNEPTKTDFDIEALAEKHLGMSYEEFASQYQAEIEFCKTVTMADIVSMTDTQRMVYSKLKAYAVEMLNTTIMEAHTVNWNAGERKLDETNRATDDMSVISDFEYDGITEDGLAQIKSGIMNIAFEEALVDEYKSSGAGVNEIQNNNPDNKPRKVIENGQIRIYTPDGSVYDTSGRKVK